ncbi:MAG: hypothetical protein JWL60_2358 [Gemmatimonadetes bacterium]|jgi:glycerate 2-kinase|nr:hypothetical protein [Gemmatimonadota bacterium]
MAESRGRALLTDLYECSVAAAAPGPLTTAALGDFQLAPAQRCWLLAAGKGATAMAASAAASIQRGRHAVTGGVVVAPALAAAPCATVASLPGDHPLPGRASFTAAERIGQVARGMRGDDAALVLVSGGASSLVAAPLGGMAEAHLVQLFELVMASGLDIGEMNVVRKRFTRWGAGRLALALAPARTRVLVVSDVPGDDPADVGSGPCAPDSSTVHDVLALLRRTGIHDRLAPPMRDHLARIVRGLVPETPKRTHPAFAHVSTQVIGSNRLARDAVVARCRALGIPAVQQAALLTGEAAAAGATIATALLERARDDAPGIVVWGGETTVRLAESAPAPAARRSGPALPSIAAGIPPTGGRCQELALSAARQLSDAGEPGARITILAAGTDGRDGPTDAAGAFADARLWRAIAAAGRDPSLDLARHESWLALAAGGALFRRGLTGTNVMDVVIGLVE